MSIQCRSAEPFHLLCSNTAPLVMVRAAAAVAAGRAEAAVVSHEASGWWLSTALTYSRSLRLQEYLCLKRSNKSISSDQLTPPPPLPRPGAPLSLRPSLNAKPRGYRFYSFSLVGTSGPLLRLGQSCISACDVVSLRCGCARRPLLAITCGPSGEGSRHQRDPYRGCEASLAPGVAARPPSVTSITIRTQYKAAT